jgi:hypothetical protein
MEISVGTFNLNNLFGYDADCTVRVTVDSPHTVAESNESNNVDVRTDLG